MERRERIREIEVESVDDMRRYLDGMDGALPICDIFGDQLCITQYCDLETGRQYLEVT